MDPVPTERTTQRAHELSLQPRTTDTQTDSKETPPSSVPQEHNAAARQGHGELSPVYTDHSDEDQDGRATKVVHAFDVLGDRRKRRRVSQEPEGPASESRQETMLPGDEARDGASTVVPQGTAQVNHTDLGPVSGVLSAAPQSTPKRRRGRPPKSKSAERAKTIQDGVVEQNQQTNRQDECMQASNTPKKQRTPRKKVMQISTSGTLFEGPSALQATPPTPRGSGRSTETAKNSKNLTLKNGKFIQTLVVVIKYRDLSSEPGLFGNKITDILSKPSRNVSSKIEPRVPGKGVQESNAAKTTHPFFLGLAGQRPENSAVASAGTDISGHTTDEEPPGVDVKPPVAWKDIVFKSNKPAASKDLQLEKPVWPPLPYQHVRPTTVTTVQASATDIARSGRKSKARGCHINDKESLLSCFTPSLSQPSNVQHRVLSPERLCTTAQLALAQVLPAGSAQGVHALAAARAHALQTVSAFDRVEAPGPLPWTQQYAPTSWEQVLQPQCYNLYDWLRGLAVHHVKQGLDPTQYRPATKRRKRQKKRDDELDDFIVDDSQEFDSNKIKNAIIIVGPNGCGKTASVYAVAKQLGFEVFEIHAGMRRSQKDIFDKVGDMAQNHMVQRGQPLSRDSSVLNETELPSSQEEPAQPSVAAFLTGPGKRKALQATRTTTPQPSKEQKQSLILFEEVDHIFEDDRGFWAGVQSLIQNSKRPVVLTCNDLQNIPLEELDLHTTLTYVTPQADAVSEYLTYVAAAEGHLIQPQAIESLYRSKGCDLRATLTELDFWCQMAVGSEKCGLDWLPLFNATSGPVSSSADQPRQRIFSKDTFREGLNLLPELPHSLEDGMNLAGTWLDTAVHELHETAPIERNWPRSVTMQETLDELEVMSDAEMLDSSVHPLLYVPTFDGRPVAEIFTKRVELVHAKIACQDKSQVRPLTFACLELLSVERPVFPPLKDAWPHPLIYPVPHWQPTSHHMSDPSHFSIEG
ncbi:hypothetical protein PMZ80_008562 [Knufia obscura]|uniref:AAA+ ATPase domain-containing protein n=1 Tax=Knufia obscura TaxID=1635080 RepID=A0ABR0RGC7_9EURO|nr:hypothetical protein PMZ80_008562 [Knufia obscura]